ncbi:unnamed protein product [Haemonchus placei]|uniref:Ovule protein n=1 Tax=Haemonchus placei TaxID=6290 RepID=A0A0N4WW05_HAEPC|nr:unnamed protein product [Haemonchus placei]
MRFNPLKNDWEDCQVASFRCYVSFYLSSWVIPISLIFLWSGSTLANSALSRYSLICSVLMNILHL